MTRIVIVGASVGGVKTAQGLRSGGFDGEIVVVEKEDVAHPYDKPPLSKAYLTSPDDLGAIRLIDQEDLAAIDASWRFGVAARGLDPAAKELLLEDGERLAYDALVIATGSRARTSPWGEGPGIHVLRTTADAHALRSALQPGRRLVIVGGGFIGAEVAATARKAGVDVTIVDPLPAPMSRVLNEDVGRIFLDKHAAEGVRTRFGTGVDGVERVGRELEVRLSDGERITADALLVGIGAVVNTEWLEGSGLVVDNGIVTDGRLRAIGAADVFVVGDVCRWQHEDGSGSTRLEHWTSAADQARLVAHNLLSPAEARAYVPVEYVWSDQYDWKIQVVGRTGSAESQLIGDPAHDRFAVVYSDGARVTGAVIVNWPRALIAARRAVADRGDADALVTMLTEITAKAPAPVVS